MNNSSVQLCPCGRNFTYQNCCGLAHLNRTQAKTAEDLMRSRYTAFTLADGGYLLESHHASTRPVDEMAEIVSWAKSVKWVKLEIVKTIDGGANDEVGFVEFKAHLLEGGKKVVMHQKSKFVRENGLWVYFDLVD